MLYIISIIFICIRIRNSIAAVVVVVVVTTIVTASNRLTRSMRTCSVLPVTFGTIE
jgi:hypothetical protein